MIGTCLLLRCANPEASHRFMLRMRNTLAYVHPLDE